MSLSDVVNEDAEVPEDTSYLFFFPHLAEARIQLAEYRLTLLQIRADNLHLRVQYFPYVGLYR